MNKHQFHKRFFDSLKYIPMTEKLNKIETIDVYKN